MPATKKHAILSVQPTSILEAFGLAPGEVTCLVGAGGKTSLMYVLARALSRKDGLAITTTTTKILPPSGEETDALLLGNDERLLEGAILSKGRHDVITLACTVLESGKLDGVSPGLVDRLAQITGISGIVVEGDGSARRNLKAPNATEPVIPASTSLVIAVVGMGVVGCPLDEQHVFRASIAADLLGLPMGSVIGGDEIARLVTHPQGIVKGTPAGARIVPFLNQVDLDGDLVGARDVARAILDAGHPQIHRVVVGEARKDNFLVIE
ncbi:MAG: selenium cofactor biosynthesis protein YqeC [Dehalococcoidia bacterium]|nr:selenium cofactor biosynthesis protein YqeC [Dehalococcoidia bacterium]